MGSLKRKIARQRAKREKKEFEKIMKQQLMMFDKLGIDCSACKSPFDKNSKEHVSTWKVVVREKEDVVRLYCPECWDKANKLIKEIQNDLGVRNKVRSESPDEGQP